MVAFLLTLAHCSLLLSHKVFRLGARSNLCMTEYEALAAGDSKEHLKRAVVAGESDEDVSDGLGESDEGVSDGLAFDLSSFFSGRTKPPPPPPAPKQFDLMSLFALPPPKLPPPPKRLASPLQLLR